MLNLSKSTQYALRGMLYLKKYPLNKFIKIYQIAKDEKMPYNYLSKIFDHLTKEKLLVSSVGPLGGVKLSSTSKNSSLAKIIQLMGDFPSINECLLFGYKNCPRLKNCPIQIECHKFRKSIWKKLARFNLEKFKNARN
jgi:Rrf2 family protein